MSNQWPDNLSYKTFSKVVEQRPETFYRELFKQHQFSIKNERIAIKNLQKICEATFVLSNEKGFQAMTLRQLSEKTGMSMGGLYAYIQSKDDLATLIYSFLERYCSDKLTILVSDKLSTNKQLIALIHAHIYLSELMQPWFYFAYMETKNLAKSFKGAAIQSEIKMEDKIFQLIKNNNSLSTEKAQLTASLVKAMLQDWYLKRWKYKKRKISVDKYAEQVVDILITYINRA